MLTKLQLSDALMSLIVRKRFLLKLISLVPLISCPLIPSLFISSYFSWLQISSCFYCAVSLQRLCRPATHSRTDQTAEKRSRRERKTTGLVQAFIRGSRTDAGSQRNGSRSSCWLRTKKSWLYEKESGMKRKKRV